MQSLNANSNEPEVSFGSPQLMGEGQHPDKLQGHWILARAGKRVLRPGGLELTRQMLDALTIRLEDRIVEFAPGLGVTARMVLQHHPLAYWGVEREPAAAEYLRKQLSGYGAEIVLGQAEKSGLPNACASVVYGEVILSMQSQEQKNRIFAEARRLLAAGGRYGIHELCFSRDDVSHDVRHEIGSAMAKEIHAGIQPLSRSEWVRMFEQNGLKVIWTGDAPMHLLEPRRVLQDEGVRGCLRIAFRIATKSMLRHRVQAMRRLFHKYEEHLGAISLVGQREPRNA